MRRSGCAVRGFGGRVRGGREALYELGATALFPLSGRRERAARDLAELGESLGRLVSGLAAPRP